MILQAICLLFCVFLFQSAQANTDWTTVWGADHESRAGKSVKVTSAGSFYFLGSSNDSLNNFDVVFSKLDNHGNILSEWRHGTPYTDQGNYLCLSPAGNLVAVGETDSSGSSGFFFMESDTLGQLIRFNRFGHSGGRESLKYIEPVSGGGYIACGFATQADGGANDFLIARFDNSGQLLWKKFYGFSGNDYAQVIRVVSDGGFIVSGDSWQGSDYDVYLLRLDDQGEAIWDRIIGDANYNGNQFVLEETSGSFFLIGESTLPGQTGFDIYLSRVAADGSVLWKKYMGAGGTEAGFSALQLAGGNILIAGYTNSFNSNSALNFFLLESDTGGNCIGLIHFNDSLPAIPYDLQPAGDGSFLLAGSSGNRFCLIKTEAGPYTDLFSVVDGIQASEADHSSVHVYPNPSSAGFAYQGFHAGQIQLLDMAGVIVREWNSETGSGMQDLSGLNPGYYRLFQPANSLSVSLILLPGF
jgi:hypothetical protein